MTKVGKRTIIILGAIAAALAMCLVFLAITTKADDTVTAVATGAAVVSAAETSLKSMKAIAAAGAIAIVAAAGAIAMAMSIKKSVESIARQPEAEGSIRSTLMIGLVFIETAIIYALIVAILIIFVL